MRLQKGQNWFHVKFEWQKNPEISTLFCIPNYAAQVCTDKIYWAKLSIFEGFDIIKISKVFDLFLLFPCLVVFFLWDMHTLITFYFEAWYQYQVTAKNHTWISHKWLKSILYSHWMRKPWNFSLCQSILQKKSWILGNHASFLLKDYTVKSFRLMWFFGILVKMFFCHKEFICNASEI